MPNALRQGHVSALDGIRGLAVLLVMWCHLTGYGGTHAFDDWFHYLAFWGWVGVDLFFVLSGYLITGILLDTRRSPRFFRDFYARRVLRIFPLYYALVVLSLHVIPRFLPHDQAERFGQVAGNEIFYWFYLQNFTIARAGGVRHAILDITWSLAIEEQFYLVWPAVVYFCSPRAVERLCAALFAVSLAARIVASRHFHLAPFSIYVLTPCRMDALAAGAFLAVRARKPPGLAALVPAAKRVGLAAGLAALGIGVGEHVAGLATIYQPGQGPISVLLGFTLVALAFGALLVVVVEAPPTSRLHRVFASRWLQFFGVYSYGLYLFHLPVRAILAIRVYGPAYRAPPHRFFATHGTEILGQLLFYPLALAVIVPVAWLSYHLYEKRFLALKRYFGERRRAEGAPASP